MFLPAIECPQSPDIRLLVTMLQAIIADITVQLCDFSLKKRIFKVIPGFVPMNKCSQSVEIEEEVKKAEKRMHVAAGNNVCYGEEKKIRKNEPLDQDL